MKIQSYYPQNTITKKLNQLFDLPYNGQDWEVVNADDERVEEFIAYYLEAEDTEEKVAMFALLYASIDMLKTKAEQETALKRIESKVLKNLNYHLNTIIYWALIGYGNNEEHIFMMTHHARDFLKKHTDLDKFEIITPTIEGIKINDISLLSILEEKELNISFSELMLFFNKESGPDNRYFESSDNSNISVEKEGDFTHFEIWSSTNGCHYFRVETEIFEREIKKYLNGI